MKGSQLYMMFLFVFLVLVFLFEYMAPHKFVWKPTYDKFDKDPFGSFVFDDVLSSSIDHYIVENKTFYQIFQEDSTSSGRAFLITEDRPLFGPIDIEYLFKLLHIGNKVMICTDDFPYLLKDTLHFDVSYDRYTPFHIQYEIKNTLRDTIFFGTDTLSPERIFEVFTQIHPVTLTPYEGRQKDVFDIFPNEEAPKDAPISPFEGGQGDVTDGCQDDVPLSPFEGGQGDVTDVYQEEVTKESQANVPDSCQKEIYYSFQDFIFKVWDNKNKPLAIQIPIAEGELFLVSTPLMFTNFGILDGNNASYIFHLLSLFVTDHLIRIEAYGDHDEKPQSPLRYVLSEAPLRWATYSILTLFVLFFFFTAKRRQRIIPIIKTPPNRTLGFMQLISNLFYQKHDNIELLKMKYLYFCTEIKDLIGIALYEQIPGETDYERLVEKTGMERDLIYQFLQKTQKAINSQEVNDIQLKQHIDGMNEILRGLKTENIPLPPSKGEWKKLPL